MNQFTNTGVVLNSAENTLTFVDPVTQTLLTPPNGPLKPIALPVPICQLPLPLIPAPRTGAGASTREDNEPDSVVAMSSPASPIEPVELQPKIVLPTSPLRMRPRSHARFLLGSADHADR